MRSVRFLTGTLLLSLVATVVLGDFFHAEKAALIQENQQIAHHAHGHISHDADVSHVPDTINSATTDESCDSDNAQLDAINPLLQRFSQIDVGCVSPISFRYEVESFYISIPHSRIRSVPLFEDASLFAATISMRV